MQKLTTLILLLFGNFPALFPAAAAPADTPAGVVEAARRAVDGDHLGEFFTQFSRIPFNNLDRATVLNHLFAKPQFMMGDVAKQSLITILHDMHKNRFTAVGPIAAQLKISMEWRDYLKATNEKLSDFFKWIDDERIKLEAQGKESASTAIDPWQNFKEAAIRLKNQGGLHPYAVAKNLKQHMPENDGRVLLFARLVDFARDYNARMPIFALLGGKVDTQMFGLFIGFDKRTKDMGRILYAVPPSDRDVFVDQILGERPSQLVPTENAIDGAKLPIHFPKELLKIIADYAVPFRFGRSVTTCKPITIDAPSTNSITWIFNHQLIDDIAGIHTLPNAKDVVEIGIEGHLLEQLPSDVWQHFPRLGSLSIINGLLTDYPVEIERLPNLTIFNLDGNLLSDDAKARYKQFERILHDRQREAAQKKAEADLDVAALDNHDFHLG